MKVLSLLVCIFCFNTIYTQSFEAIVNLNHYENDELTVQLNMNNISGDTLLFSMPKIVPGTYSLYDFGRYIKDLEAFDKQGNHISVVERNVNQWFIEDGRSLQYIIYKVIDTFDDTTKPQVFQPAGTCFSEDVFVLNLHAMIGYVDGYERAPYTIQIEKPNVLFGSTAMLDRNTSDERDEFFVENYHQLIDYPILYCHPDTASTMIDGTKMFYSIYSPNHKYTAGELQKTVDKVIQSQKAYLGVLLDAPRYAVLAYLEPNVSEVKAYGALEHHYSTFAYFPEGGGMDVYKGLAQVLSHEFFHTIMPLKIHSEIIHDFDYQSPTMSRHLWFYEGCTEYLARHFRVHQGDYPAEKHLSVLKSLLEATKHFNDSISFIDLSQNLFAKDLMSQYHNVYMKGALIGMCLDILLIHESKGKRDLRSLLVELEAEYGRDKPFDDKSFLNYLSRMTYPSVERFLQNHVAGGGPLPLKRILSLAGVQYEPTFEKTGHVPLLFTPRMTHAKIFVGSLETGGPLDSALGLQVGDTLIECNGVEASPVNFMTKQCAVKENTKEYVLKIKRGDKEMELKSPVQEGSWNESNYFAFIDEEKLTKRQKLVKQKWLGKGLGEYED